MKLPTNPLLHCVSLTAVVGMGYSAMELRESSAVHAQQQAGLSKIVRDIASAVPPFAPEGWDYRKKAFWQTFAEVNFTGKSKAKPVATPGAGDPPPTQHQEVDVKTLLRVVAITLGNGMNGCVIDYQTSVEVPPEYQPAPSTRPLSSMPKGRSNMLSQPQLGATTTTPPHHLKVGDALWKPYDFVVLQAIRRDAESVTFELRTKRDANEKFPRQEVPRNILDLPADVVDSLLRGRRAATTKRVARTEKPAPTSSYWIDRPTTVVDRQRGRVDLSRRDAGWLTGNASQILAEDLQMRDYVGGTGARRVRGVQIRKLSPRVRRLGLHSGDVITKINNQPVKGMAHTRNLGRKLYRRGVRTFKVELTRRGVTETLTYHLPK